MLGLFGIQGLRVSYLNAHLLFGGMWPYHLTISLFFYATPVSFGKPQLQQATCTQIRYANVFQLYFLVWLFFTNQISGFHWGFTPLFPPSPLLDKTFWQQCSRQCGALAAPRFSALAKHPRDKCQLNSKFPRIHHLSSSFSVEWS